LSRLGRLPRPGAHAAEAERPRLVRQVGLDGQGVEVQPRLEARLDPRHHPGHVDLEARLDQLLEHAELAHQRVARALEHYSASTSGSAWPLGETLYCALWILPLASMMKVERMMPLNLRP